MKTIVRPQGQGKTTEAIRIANETGAYLVVPSREAAMALQDRCDRFPITYEELLQTRLRGSFVRNVVIDNVEMFAAYVCGGLTIDAVTVTAPPQE